MDNEQNLYPAFVDLMTNMVVILLLVLALSIQGRGGLEAEIVNGLGDARGTVNIDKEIAKLNQVLDASDLSDKQKQVQLAELGTRLNRALAAKTQQLKNNNNKSIAAELRALADRLAKE